MTKPRVIFPENNQRLWLSLGVLWREVFMLDWFFFFLQNTSQLFLTSSWVPHRGIWNKWPPLKLWLFLLSSPNTSWIPGLWKETLKKEMCWISTANYEERALGNNETNVPTLFLYLSWDEEETEIRELHNYVTIVWKASCNYSMHIPKKLGCTHKGRENKGSRGRRE